MAITTTICTTLMEVVMVGMEIMEAMELDTMECIQIWAWGKTFI